MPCGMSSLLVQVTVVPAFTVKFAGVKVKLSIDTASAGAAFCADVGMTTAANAVAGAAPSAAAISALRTVFEMAILFSLNLQRRVDEGEPLFVLFERDIGD